MSAVRRGALGPGAELEHEAGGHEQTHDHDHVRDERPVAVERVGAFVLEEPQHADGHEHHAGAEQQRPEDPESDDPGQALERLGGLLLEVGNDEFPELGHCLRDRCGTVGHVRIQHARSACGQALGGIRRIRARDEIGARGGLGEARDGRGHRLAEGERGGFAEGAVEEQRERERAVAR